MARVGTPRRHRGFGLALLGAALSSAWFVPLQSQAATGTMRGHVTLVATGPANPPIRMGADPACSTLYGDTRPVQEFVVRAADGGLANVFAYVVGSFPGTPVPTTPLVLDQRGCVYRPHVLGIRAGQPLQITNSDPTLHNMHGVSAKGNDFNVSRPKGAPPAVVTLGHGETMMRITCDLHSWMNIYVAVMDHPYFSVTDTGGRFEIAGVPAGRRQVEVWHERFGPLTATVDVPAGRTVDVEFSYQGTEKAAAPAGGAGEPS